MTYNEMKQAVKLLSKEWNLGKKENIVYPCKEFWKIASEYKYLKVLYGVDAHFKYQIMNYENGRSLYIVKYLK